MRNLIILLAVLCASCGTALPTIKPYKLDVQQGNVVTSKMLLQLRPGMTKSQVRFIMGTPLIQDSFHGNRWDYVYQMRESGKIIEQRRVILDFESELLKTVRGDVIASAGDKSSADENIGTRVINPSAKPEEKSLMSKLKFWQKDEAEIAKEKAEEKAKAIEADKLKADEAAKKAAKLNAKTVAPVEQSQPVPVAPIEPAIVVPESKPTETSVAATADTLNGKGSSSGMKLERTLNLPTEEPLAKPASTTKTPTKVTPKPKDLPAESEPSYFDKMLEKIGF
jgi:outer membrane protein assembly factor BamE